MSIPKMLERNINEFVENDTNDKSGMDKLIYLRRL